MKYTENNITVSTDDLPDKNFPLEIFCRMVYNSIKQGRTKEEAKRQLKISTTGGFLWHLSNEGIIFWNDVINFSNFKTYYDKYPKCEGTYIVDECYISCFTETMPEEIKQEILKTAARLGKLDNIYTTNIRDIFRWENTPQGYKFWEAIYKNYFSEKYTLKEDKETKVSSSETQITDKQITNKTKKSEFKFIENEFKFNNIKKKKVRF